MYLFCSAYKFGKNIISIKIKKAIFRKLHKNFKKSFLIFSKNGTSSLKDL